MFKAPSYLQTLILTSVTSSAGTSSVFCSSSYSVMHPSPQALTKRSTQKYLITADGVLSTGQSFEEPEVSCKKHSCSWELIDRIRDNVVL